MAVSLTNGKIFGRWIVLSEAPMQNGNYYWLCRCQCGVERKVRGTALKSGKTISCGCYALEKSKEKTKPFRNSSEYGIYNGMLSRCRNENDPNYRKYGLKGIEVCDRWKGKNGFDNFISDMGRRPSKKHSIDRFPNNKGNYEPSNCRWATQKEQMRNVCYNVWIEYDGKKMILRDWALYLKVPEAVISQHLKRKSVEEAMKYVSSEYNGKKKICIGQFKNELLIKFYNSAKQVEENGFTISSVYRCLRGVSDVYKGFQWKYLEQKVA